MNIDIKKKNGQLSIIISFLQNKHFKNIYRRFLFIVNHSTEVQLLIHTKMHVTLTYIRATIFLTLITTIYIT